MMNKMPDMKAVGSSMIQGTKRGWETKYNVYFLTAGEYPSCYGTDVAVPTENLSEALKQALEMSEVKSSNITVATFTPLADNLVSAGDLMGATTGAPICVSLPPQCDQTSTSPDGSVHSPSNDSNSPRQDTPHSWTD